MSSTVAYLIAGGHAYFVAYTALLMSDHHLGGKDRQNTIMLGVLWPITLPWTLYQLYKRRKAARAILDGMTEAFQGLGEDLSKEFASLNKDLNEMVKEINKRTDHKE